MSQGNPPDSGKMQMRVGLITVEVVQGNIANETTDAIVNSTNDSLVLAGQVSKALIEKGGNKVAADCQAKGTIGNKGVFAASAAGTSLPCKYILHVDINRTAGTLVKECLEEADRLKLKSIAIPAIGTGVHGADPEKIVPGIVSGAEEFISSIRCPNLRLIRFVVFQPNMIPIFRSAVSLSLGRPAVRGVELPSGKEVAHKQPTGLPVAAAATNNEFTFEVAATCLNDNTVNDYIQFGTENGVRVTFDRITGHVTVSSADKVSRDRVYQHIEVATNDMQMQMAVARKVQWQFQQDQHEWCDYSLPLNMKLENAHKAKQSALTYRSGICTFVVDLAHEQDYIQDNPDNTVAVRRNDKLMFLP